MRFHILSFFLCLAALLPAQNISVASFELDPNDLTANLEGTTVYDQNGQKCALIRIQTTQKGFSFDVGSLGVQKVDDNKVGEIWLYVPGGVKRLTMRHQQLGSLLNYPFPITVVGSKTYVMQLTTANVHTIIEEAVTQQYVVFQVTPQNASLIFDGDFLELSEGTASKRKSFGTYDYTAQAALYHPQTGTITVNDPDKRHEVAINLKPAFGFLEIPATDALQGARVFVDNELKGTVPFRSDRLASGNHQLRLMKDLYATFVQDFTISDGETLTLSPKLTSDFARITLAVDGNAEIWVNDERKGAGTWTGNLATGDYKVQCRLAGHRSTTKELSIDQTMDGTTFRLAAPSPIYGRLDISSSPANADIYLDGQKVGTTPMMLPKCLVGQHTLKVSKAGHSDFTQTFTLAENATEEINARLESGKPVTITAPEGADIYIDGAKVATTRFEGTLAFGNHTAYAMQGGKKSGEKNINVSMQGGEGLTVMLNFGKTKTYTVKGISFDMVFVEGGTFLMGSNDGGYSEKPTHQVTLSDYYLGQTEVTQELWEAVMGNNPSDFKGAKNPVNKVSWNDCQDFTRKLNSLTGANFRLPTEAEWEFAARGGNKSRGYKYSGSDNLGSVAWYEDNSGNKAHPMGGKSPNELGLYDMSGNVWEWCADRFGSYPSSSQINPTGPSSGSNRVRRGGSWFSITMFGSVTNRYSGTPSLSDNDLGLRLAH